MTGDLIENNRQVLQRAEDAVDFFNGRKMPVKLIGGLAILYLSKDTISKYSFLQRRYSDMDFFAHKKDVRDLKTSFADFGLTPDTRFNALNGDTRLLCYDGEKKVDFFLDIFKMCHTWVLGKRIDSLPKVIPPSDLLLTKLQIFELNEKDILDIISLTLSMDIDNKDTLSSVDVSYIEKLLSSDWGLYKTVTMNLEKVSQYSNSLKLEEKDREDLNDKIKFLSTRIEEHPKSLKWKMRASIGTKVKWYELPEQVG